MASLLGHYARRADFPPSSPGGDQRNRKLTIEKRARRRRERALSEGPGAGWRGATGQVRPRRATSGIEQSRNEPTTCSAHVSLGRGSGLVDVAAARAGRVRRSVGWPHPGLPYPIWLLHKAESKLHHPNPSFSSRWAKRARRHLPEGCGSSGLSCLQATQQALKLDCSSLPP
jgi:hypothetical protein